MDKQKLDHDCYARQLREQAYASAHILNEEQKRKRILDKIDRARVYSDALHRSVWWQRLNS
jgi:hypothetical protein